MDHPVRPHVHRREELQCRTGVVVQLLGLRPALAAVQGANEEDVPFVGFVVRGNGGIHHVQFILGSDRQLGEGRSPVPEVGVARTEAGLQEAGDALGIAETLTAVGGLGNIELGQALLAFVIRAVNPGHKDIPFGINHGHRPLHDPLGANRVGLPFGLAHFAVGAAHRGPRRDRIRPGRAPIH